MKSFNVFAPQDFPLIKPGDDIAKTIVETMGRNGLDFENGDIVVVAQKIVSKSENRIVRLKDTLPSEKAEQIARTSRKNPKFVELVLKEANRVLKVSGDVLLVEDKRGLICINAGIDKSNVEGRDTFAYLPEDPDRSAREYRLRIKQLTSKNVALIVCDTYSRPFRRGQVNFSIGFSGIKPFKDYRGKKDLFKQVLKVKNIAVVDEIAAAAELLMGQATEATPVVIFRGLDDIVEFCEECSVKDLYISSEEDLFRNSL